MNARLVIEALKSKLKSIPFVTDAYRSLRDWRTLRRDPVRTPLGFRFCGTIGMENGTFEPEETRLVPRILPAVDVFINVGANAGYYCCLAAMHGKPVVAFEPLRRNVDILVKNLRANGWEAAVELYPMALGSGIGIMPMYGAGTGASLLKGSAGVARGLVSWVACSTMDNVLGSRFADRRCLILVDVEGAERALLEGASKFLAADVQPIWIVEIAATENQPQGMRVNPQFLDTFRVFLQAGYASYAVVPGLPPITERQVENIQRSGGSGPHVRSYLFIGKDQVDRVLPRVTIDTPAVDPSESSAVDDRATRQRVALALRTDRGLPVASDRAFGVYRLSHLDECPGRKNNLNVVRQVLASLVVFSHCYLIHDTFDQEPMRRAIGFGNLGAIAVWSFFLISGFLISKSGAHSTPARFCAARVLRIFPALIVAVIACTFVVGPLETTLTLREYLTQPETYRFLRRALLQNVPNTLPGVFEDGWIWHTVNGPLWTLSAEWVLYAAILIFFTIWSCCRKTIRWSYGGVVCVVALATIVTTFPLPWRNAAGWFGFGALGFVASVFRSRILLCVPVALAGIGVTTGLLLVMPLAGAATLPFTLGYALLVVGYHPALQVDWYRRVGDYSYGTYVYAWPIQQMLFPYSADAMHLFVLSLPLTLGVAAVSWHFVEKPALGLLPARNRTGE
jgi:FkbM family methyltransferase